jgi:hypothetical protein
MLLLVKTSFIHTRNILEQDQTPILAEYVTLIQNSRTCTSQCRVIIMCNYIESFDYFYLDLFRKEKSINHYFT